MYPVTEDPRMIRVERCWPLTGIGGGVPSFCDLVTHTGLDVESVRATPAPRLAGCEVGRV